MMKARNLMMLSLAALIALLAGCTKEDLTECGIDIRFKYDYNTARVNKFTSDIHKLNLFIFNEAGECVREYEDAGTFGDDYRMRLKLVPGVYDFVVWGELAEDNMVMNRGLNRLVPPFTDDRLNLQSDAGNQVLAFPHNLYYGVRKKVEVFSFGNDDVLISMVKDTKSIRVIFKGLPTSNPLTMDNLVCRIVAVNGDYNFDNGLMGNRELTYMPQGGFQVAGSALTLTEDFVTMRLFADNSCHSRLTLEYRPTNTNTVKILDAKLTDLIIHEYPSVDFVRDDVFLLEFDYTGDYTFTNYTITVNGWKVATSNAHGGIVG